MTVSATPRLPLPAVIGFTVAVIGAVVAGVMYFEEQFKQLEDHLGDLSLEMATQSQRLDDISVYAAQARADREELDDGQKEIRADVAGVRQYVGDALGFHAGEHGRFEGAADRFEELLRRLEAKERE